MFHKVTKVFFLFFWFLFYSLFFFFLNLRFTLFSVQNYFIFLICLCKVFTSHRIILTNIIELTVKPSHVDHSTQNTKGKTSGSSNSRSSSTAYSTNNSVGSSTSNMPQQQQSQSQQVASQPQNVPQTNNNQSSSNGRDSGSNSVANYHHGGYGGVPYAVHHGGHHSLYHPVINAGLQPGNVYVNNVTANVNVGWTGGHPSVQAAYIPNSQSYITGSSGHPVEVVGDQVSLCCFCIYLFAFGWMRLEGFGLYLSS